MGKLLAPKERKISVFELDGIDQMGSSKQDCDFSTFSGVDSGTLYGMTRAFSDGDIKVTYFCFNYVHIY